MSKPRGVLRIDLPQAKYTLFTAGELAYAFRVSQLVTIEMPPADVTEDWLNVTYPSLNVKMYCSYRSITPETLLRCEAECRELVARSTLALASSGLSAWACIPKITASISAVIFSGNHPNSFGRMPRWDSFVMPGVVRACSESFSPGLGCRR